MSPAHQILSRETPISRLAPFRRGPSLHGNSPTPAQAKPAILRSPAGAALDLAGVVHGMARSAAAYPSGVLGRASALPWLAWGLLGLASAAFVLATATFVLAIMALALALATLAMAAGVFGHG